MLVAPLNETTAIRMLATDGNTSLFPRVNIYNAAGTLVTALTLTHVAEGLYSADWTPSVSGLYSAVGQFFVDALFTTDAGYEKSLEDVEVSTLKAAIARLLGLAHENVVIDLQTYNTDGCITSARVRIYDSKANAQAAGATGLEATYTQTFTYTGGQMSGYEMVRDS